MKGAGNLIPVYTIKTVKMKKKKHWTKITIHPQICITLAHYVHNEMWQCRNLGRLPHQVVTDSSQTGSLELLCMHASKLSWRSRSGNFAGFPSKISLWNLCEDHCTSPWQASWPAAKTVADKDCTVFASTEIASRKLRIETDQIFRNLLEWRPPLSFYFWAEGSLHFNRILQIPFAGVSITST